MEYSASIPQAKYYLDKAHEFATFASGCKKVQVGSVIVRPDDGTILAAGANVTVPSLCRSTECLRVQKYGEDSKSHRNPEDCRAVHSEINALVNMPCLSRGMAIFVTRYPCEACARAIVSAGIDLVVYGRQQEISDETKEIFEAGGVPVIWENTWTEEDTNR